MGSDENKIAGIEYDRISGVSPEDYAEDREKHAYILVLRKLLRRLTSFSGLTLFPNAQQRKTLSIADVGTYNVDMISRLDVPTKVSIDLVRPLESPGFQSIKSDWLKYDPSVRFDMICCFQVLEHVKEPAPFARKLLAQANQIVVVSVPYEWPEGKCVGHIHDPVDERKLRKWMGREYDWAFRTIEPNGGIYAKRLIAVYYKDSSEAGVDLLRTLSGDEEAIANLKLGDGVESALLDLQRDLIQQQQFVMREQREIITGLRTAMARGKTEADGLRTEIEQLRELESCKSKQIKELEARKSKEYEELSRRKSLMVDGLTKQVISLRGNVDAGQQRILEFESSVNAGQQKILELESSVDAGQRKILELKSIVNVDQQKILELDETARGLAMAMHARDARAPWWLRPFMPKWALPLIGKPVKMHTPSAPKTASDSAMPMNRNSDSSSISITQPVAPTLQASMNVRFPGSFERYPDRTGRRIAEGGRRLKGEKRASLPGKPLVSIITTVRNGERYLEQAMESVFTQTWPNVEYIVVDGASTDGTLDLIKRHADKIDYFLSEPDAGIYAGMNKGIELAHGDFILILNSDDFLISPEAISLLARQIQIGVTDAVLGTCLWVDAKGNIKRRMRSIVDERLFVHHMVPHGAALISKEAYRHFGLYSETFRITADWVWMRQSLPRIRCKVIDDDIHYFRMIGISHNCDTTEICKERYQVLRAEIPGFSWEEFWPIRWISAMQPKETSDLMRKYSHHTPFREALSRFLAEMQTQG